LLAFATGVAGCHMGLAGVVAGSAKSHGPYRGNELVTELGAGSVRTMGCLDVGLAIEDRPKGEHLTAHVGNRCAHAEAIDLKRLGLTAFDGESAPVGVTLSDPRSEIVELHVGPAERGHEHIRLAKNESARLARVCFDLRGIAPDAPDATPAPICLVRSASGPFVAGGAQ